MIRKFEMDDLPRVMQIWLGSNIQAHEFIPRGYWEEHFEQVEAALPAAELYVFQEDDSGAVNGFIGMSSEYIEGIFVESGARSRGIGKKLLDYVKPLKGHLTLKVYQKNERAVRFYLREGFLSQSSKKDEKTGENEILMIWQG